MKALFITFAFLVSSTTGLSRLSNRQFRSGPANTVAQHHVPDANKRAELVEAVKKKHPHPPQELVVPACDGANSASIVKSSAWRALVDFQKVLESMDAPSMIYSGTVLGLARHCDPTIGKTSDDVDFAVDSNWLRLNFRELAKKIVSGGFQPKWYFPGAHEERSFQSIPQKILNVKGFEVSWTHRNKMKVDLFGVTVTNATIEWGLWTGRTAFDWNDCIGQATDVVPFTWHGLKVHVPVPVDAYLTSLYGKKYMTPAKWTWDVEPFTIGSCTRTPRSASLRALEQQYPHR